MAKSKDGLAYAIAPVAGLSAFSSRAGGVHDSKHFGMAWLGLIQMTAAQETTQPRNHVCIWRSLRLNASPRKHW